MPSGPEERGAAAAVLPWVWLSEEELQTLRQLAVVDHPRVLVDGADVAGFEAFAKVDRRRLVTPRLRSWLRTDGSPELPPSQPTGSREASLADLSEGILPSGTDLSSIAQHPGQRWLLVEALPPLGELEAVLSALLRVGWDRQRPPPFVIDAARGTMHVHVLVAAGDVRGARTR